MTTDKFSNNHRGLHVYKGGLGYIIRRCNVVARHRFMEEVKSHAHERSRRAQMDRDGLL